MKLLAKELVATATLVSVILGVTYVEYASVKNAADTQAQAAQEKNPQSETQYAAKRDSFIAGKAFGEKRGGLDSMEAQVGRGKSYILRHVNNRLRQLEPFRNRVQNMTSLSGSERNRLVSELNADIGLFESLKSEISRSATKQDIKDVADKVKTAWLKNRLNVQRAERLMMASRENQLAADADEASLGMQNRIADLKATGKDVKAHEELLSAFANKIASAKQDVDSAKEKFDAAAGVSSAQQRQKLMKNKDLLLTNARASIKDAYKMVAEEARQEFSQRFK